MLFADLPNEILTECFKYLDIFEIFHSFNKLNFRFQALICYYPLAVDFHDDSQSQFDNFCEIIRSNRMLQKQLRSLRLSNENFPEIHLFLSMLSLSKFPNIQSLTLVELKQCDRLLLPNQLPTLSPLSCIRLIKCNKSEISQILSSIQTSHLRTLSVSELFAHDKLLCNISTLQYLTLSTCDTEKLHHILDNALQLKYLNVDTVNRCVLSQNTISENLVPIKQLILKKYEDNLVNLESIFKRISNLNSLTISINNINVIDADQWQFWINYYLPELKKFRFYFHFNDQQLLNTIQEIFQKFQSNFWTKEHQWFTEYIVSRNSASIYSIPYFLDSFKLERIVSRYECPLIPNSNKYENVKCLEIGLSIEYTITTGLNLSYFTNVDSLIFSATSILILRLTMSSVDLIRIKKVIFNVQHEIRSAFLYGLFQQASNISSLSIDIRSFTSLINTNDASRGYLKKTIKQLNFLSHHSDFTVALQSVYERLRKFFSISDRFNRKCTLYGFLFFLIEFLPKLTRIETPSSSCTHNFDTVGFVKLVAQELNVLIDIDNNRGRNTQDPMIVWITRLEG